MKYNGEKSIAQIYAERLVRSREYVRTWQKKNPDKVRECSRRWHEKNADKVKAYSRQYYQEVKKPRKIHVKKYCPDCGIERERNKMLCAQCAHKRHLNRKEALKKKPPAEIADNFNAIEYVKSKGLKLLIKR